jgi:hypothetical protein
VTSVRLVGLKPQQLSCWAGPTAIRANGNVAMLIATMNIFKSFILKVTH